MNIDFLLVLVILTLVSGLLVGLDKLVLARRRESKQRMPLIIDYARSFFPVLLVVLLIRSFLIEPYRIPSGSLKPTLLINEFIVVNKYAYGLRWPVLNSTFFKIGEPKRGDIALFRYPVNPSIFFIKRVIGVPGDQIIYRNKVLYINGDEVKQTPIDIKIDLLNDQHPISVKHSKEILGGVEHEIYTNSKRANDDFIVTVPEGNYFMMGDNRDASGDSRAWGFVSESLLVGRASYVFFSWDKHNWSVRWNRLGQAII